MVVQNKKFYEKNSFVKKKVEKKVITKKIFFLKNRNIVNTKTKSEKKNYVFEKMRLKKNRKSEKNK